jgi:hypothetical protein
VDALCIIQDDLDEKDWYEQSGKMQQIYSNCHLAIAADDSPKSTQGFWDIHEEEWTKITSRRIRYIRYPPGWVRKSKNDTLSWTDALSRRGWALQESILPNRILHFTTRGMRWECNHYCRQDDRQAQFNLPMLTFRALRVIRLGRLTQRQLPEGLLGGRHLEDDEMNTTHITDFLTTYGRTTVYFAWNSIMEYYSEKELTRGADKLAAISGLAGLVVEYLGLQSSSYLAGLWLEDLASSLLWYVKGPRTPRRAQSYIAPTWSWASIDGCIGYFRERYQFHFQSLVGISEAKCFSSPSDPTGRVKSGQIILTGDVVPVSLNVIRFPKEFKSEYTGGPGCASRTHLDQVVLVRSLLSRELVSYEVLCDEEMDIQGCCQRENCACSTLRSAGKYYCLQIGVTEDLRTGGRRFWWLLLEKKTSANETYQRRGLGYFQVKWRSFHRSHVRSLARSRSREGWSGRRDGK